MRYFDTGNGIDLRAIAEGQESLIEDTWIEIPATGIPAIQLLKTDIADLQKLAKSKISAHAKSLIETRVKSAALGVDHWYDAKEKDQLNIGLAILDGIDIPYSCYETINGIKVHKLHTIAQLRQVLSDGAAIKKAALIRANQLANALTTLTKEQLRDYDVVARW